MEIVTWETPIVITESAQESLLLRAVLLDLVTRAMPYAEDDSDLDAAITNATAALYGEELPDEDEDDALPPIEFGAGEPAFEDADPNPYAGTLSEE